MTLKHSLKIENWKLKITLLVLTLFMFVPKVASAGFIVQRPLYIGLTDGLVGYRSFDGMDIGVNQKPRIAAGHWRILIQNDYSSFTT